MITQPATAKFVISAKVPLKLVREIDRVSTLLNIPTRSEFIEKAVRQYIETLRGTEQSVAPREGENHDSY